MVLCSTGAKSATANACERSTSFGHCSTCLTTINCTTELLQSSAVCVYKFTLGTDRKGSFLEQTAILFFVSVFVVSDHHSCMYYIT